MYFKEPFGSSYNIPHYFLLALLDLRPNVRVHFPFLILSTKTKAHRNQSSLLSQSASSFSTLSSKLTPSPPLTFYFSLSTTCFLFNITQTWYVLSLCSNLVSYMCACVCVFLSVPFKELNLSCFLSYVITSFEERQMQSF